MLSLQIPNKMHILNILGDKIIWLLRDLLPFAHFKKREKHPWRSVTLLKVTLLCGCFSRFFKLRKWYQIAQSVSQANMSHMKKAKTYHIKWAFGLECPIQSSSGNPDISFNVLKSQIILCLSNFKLYTSHAFGVSSQNNSIFMSP